MNLHPHTTRENTEAEDELRTYRLAKALADADPQHPYNRPYTQRHIIMAKAAVKFLAH